MDPFSQSSRSYDTDLMIFRTLFALNPDTNLPISTNFVVTTDGIGGLVWMDPFQNLSTAGPGVGYLPSTIFNLQTNLSTLSSSVSTINVQYKAGLSSLSTTLGLAYIPTGIYVDNLNSTVTGLATVGYVSSTQLRSTVIGLGSADYVSTASLVSSVNWFVDPTRYISTGNLISTTAGVLPNINVLSTVTGLGSIGYVSTLSLFSSISALSTLVFSTQQLNATSTVRGLGSAGYISSTQLLSSLTGLGSLSYVSSTQLISTTSWLLDASRYVSTGALVSTTAGISTNLQTSFFVDNAGVVNIYNGNVVFSSASNVVYLSSFVFSSITYEGNNGILTATTYNGSPPRSMLFSSARIRMDRFSSFITSQSRVFIDYYPTFVFSGIYQGASGYLLRNMSTYLQYGATHQTQNQASSWVYANNTSNAFGNLYQQPIKLQIPGSVFLNNYANPYVISHNLVSSLTFDTTNGFKNNTIEVQVGSTNSLFLTIQNLP
jgi:uncharacterized membrane protein